MSYQAPMYYCPDCGRPAIHGPCVHCNEYEIEPKHMRPDFKEFAKLPTKEKPKEKGR